LADALAQARAQLHIEPEPFEAVVAEVRGVCRLDPATNKLVPDLGKTATDAPLLRIVAFKAGVYAFSVKGGSNLARVPGAPSVTVSERGASAVGRARARRPL